MKIIMRTTIAASSLLGGLGATPPENTLVIPYPDGDREAFFIVEEVPVP